MKFNVLKRAFVLTALGASMATAAFAAPTGPVMIPQPGTVVVINHNPDVTFAGNINFDIESQENNNLRIGSTVVPNVLYGAVFNRSGAPDTIVPAQTYVFTGAKEVPAALTAPSDEGKPGATWSVETIKKTKSGDIQVYFRKDVLGEEAYKYVKMLDIGDIIGVEGHVFKTHTGEVTIKVNKLTLLSKSLRPLPEKWHGLKDTELRYRQRYVDLIVNPEVRDTFVKRSQIVAKIREYMMRDGFMEVETPMMHAIPGGAAARPFITHHNALDIDIYMRIAPELYLKRLIVGGMDRVFEMNRCFRNEGIDNRHNPEFTTIESYQAYGDVEDAIRLTENLVSYCAQEVLGTQEITYQGTEINLTPPWNRITMAEGVKKYTGEDFDAVTTIEEARAIADRLNVEYTENDGIGKILNLCFEDSVHEN